MERERIVIKGKPTFIQLTHPLVIGYLDSNGAFVPLPTDMEVVYRPEPEPTLSQPEMGPFVSKIIMAPPGTKHPETGQAGHRSCTVWSWTACLFRPGRAPRAWY